jgi:hypothetical protein
MTTGGKRTLYSDGTKPILIDIQRGCGGYAVFTDSEWALTCCTTIDTNCSSTPFGGVQQETKAEKEWNVSEYISQSYFFPRVRTNCNLHWTRLMRYDAEESHCIVADTKALKKGICTRRQ